MSRDGARVIEPRPRKKRTSKSARVAPVADRSAAPSPRDRVIRVRGASEHNLKDVSVTIPRDRLVVLTGLSG